MLGRSKNYSETNGLILKLRGGADILVAFKKMEAVRYCEFLKPTGICNREEDRFLP